MADLNTSKSYPIGLKNVHFAPLKDDGTYDVPKKISAALTATVTPNYTSTTLYADDKAVAVATALGDIDIELGISDLSDEDYILLMGSTKNADGVIEDSIDDVPPYGALLFELPFDIGGARFYCYYKGKFQPPANTHNTKGSSVEFQNASISGKFVSRDDGKWRAKYDNKTKTLDAVGSAWYTTVYKPTPEV